VLSFAITANNTLIATFPILKARAKGTTLKLVVRDTILSILVFITTPKQVITSNGVVSVFSIYSFD
jgi:hypothetical protein